ncbi:MAG: T9SS type A sorting domain-containing protein [Ignavibacteria bacterium]|nr:T9SS type A sorting domain-containing protein [Ignavibacteria bacterium]
MKRFYTIALLVACITSIYGQMEVYNYRTKEKVMPVRTCSQVGGLFLPSQGTLRVLIVFCKFPEDSYTPSDPARAQLWPLNGNPYNMNSWVDTSWTGTPTPGSLTDYFDQMSLHNLHVIGDVVSVTALHTKDYYIYNHKRMGDIQGEIITQQLDPVINFAKYDNWDLSSAYNHPNQPDGVVDYVFFVWRNIAMEYSNDDRDWIMTTLDFYWYGSTDIWNVPVDNGARIVGDQGCTIPDYFYKDAFRFSIHEFAHDLIGHNNMHNGHAFWAMLSGYEVRSYMINAFERYLLGWCNLTTIDTTTQTISNATLTDYITTGNAYRFVIDAATDQYFYVENHQRISNWDKSSSDLNEKGLYVIRQDAFSDPTCGANFMKLISAAGRFDWNVIRWDQNDWGNGQLPVVRCGPPNRGTGWFAADKIPFYNPGLGTTLNYETLYREGPNNTHQVVLARNGEGKDAFRPGFVEVFSPWSNPNSQRADGQATGIGFQLKSMANGLAIFDIYVKTASSAAPSIPQGITISSSAQNHPVITWQANTEPNLSSYKIYKKRSSGSDWVLCASTTSTSYQDYCEQTSGGGTTYTVQYKVSAVNQLTKESLPAGPVSIVALGANLDKQTGDSNIKGKQQDFSLSPNYPNPFNPTTTINYTIQGNGNVVLKVFDVLGREVSTLVNEVKTAGEYSITFNASHLPSGIYFYSLHAGNFSAVKKMVLIK